MSKNILITGATGKQGGAVLDALLNDQQFTLLAVTRNASGAGAEKLKQKGNNIKVVQGNLDDVPSLFRNASEIAGGPIYGVYSVQLSQGPGVTHEGEIKQGKAMIDESIKANVKHFVYSSVERGGDEASWNNPTPIPHFSSKYEIEHYLRDNAPAEMMWTILRPVAFMDNLAPGFQSQVFIAALRDALGPKALQWVAVRDIGVFAKLAFEKPQEYNHKALGLAGHELTSPQLDQAFKTKTTQGMAGTFWAFGALLKLLVGELGLMINWFGAEGYKANITKLKTLHPGLMDIQTWIEEESAFPAKV